MLTFANTNAVRTGKPKTFIELISDFTSTRKENSSTYNFFGIAAVDVCCTCTNYFAVSACLGANHNGTVDGTEEPSQ